MSDEAFQDALMSLKDVTLKERSILMSMSLDELESTGELVRFGMSPIGRIDMPNASVFVFFNVQWNTDDPDESFERSIGLIALHKSTNVYLGGLNCAYWMVLPDGLKYDYDDEGNQFEPEEPRPLDYLDSKIYISPQKELIIETVIWKAKLTADGTFQEF